jgi:hypothetical protein
MMRGILVATTNDNHGSEHIVESKQLSIESFAISNGQMRTNERSGTYCPPVLGIFIANS